MEPPKHEREDSGKPAKKKQKKKEAGAMTEKNFGSVLDIGKVKSAKRLLVGWRMRHLRSKFHAISLGKSWGV